MKPIILTTPQVRGILDGTVTRIRIPMRKFQEADHFILHEDGTASACQQTLGGMRFADVNMPYCIGDLLYAREAWCYNNFGMFYRADWPNDDCPNMDFDDEWRSPACMPREAARLFLRVKDVRVERVQDITKEDAIAEGYSGVSWLDAKDIFITDWDERYAKRGYPYAANPWTFVSTVEKEERP